MLTAGGATMFIIGTSCRRGTSTIFGTLIFIGILFTAVIPMFLFMRQADTFYEMRKFELGRLDEERGREDLFFYIIPALDPPSLTVKVVNRGELVTKVERIWFNDKPEPVDSAVQPMSNKDLGPFVILEPGSYIIMVVTDRGNVISSMCGTPIYTGSDWQIDLFTIYIMIRDPSNSLHIEVSLIGEDPLYDEDVDPNQTGYLIDVSAEGTYKVRVTKWHDKPHEEELYNGDHALGLAAPMVIIVV